MVDNRMDSVEKLTDEKIVEQLGEVLREFEKLTELADEELASAIDRTKSIEKLTKEQALDRAAELVTVMATKELAFKQAFGKFKEKLTTAQAFDCAMGLSQLVTTTELFFKLAFKQALDRMVELMEKLKKEQIDGEPRGELSELGPSLL